MKTNPFTTARAEFKTIGEVIDALVDAFSGEGSADVMGSYMMERAAESILERRPQRQKEWDDVIARIDTLLAKVEVKTPAYAEAAHEVERYMKLEGERRHSAYSQKWIICQGGDLYTMEIITSSNVPRFSKNSVSVTSGIVYADLIQI